MVQSKSEQCSRFENKESDTPQKQVGGDHYKQLDPEPIDVIRNWGLSYCLGNVVKYVSRAGKKDDNSKKQDLEKAIHYLEFEIEMIKEEK
jgi:hypothetical protein